MEDQLQTLVRELRNQTCPPEVMDRVIRRIARDHKRTRRFWNSLSWGIAFTALLIVLGAWQWGLRTQRRTAELAAKVHADRARIAEQTTEALGYIGQVLLRTAVHTQDSISKKAVPPLRDGFQLTRNKTINRI